MAKKYSKQDEKLMKDLMNTLYDHHQFKRWILFHGFSARIYSTI